MINIREIRQRLTHVLNDHLTDSKSKLGQERNATFLAQSSTLWLRLSLPQHKTRNLRMRCNNLFLDIPSKNTDMDGFFQLCTIKRSFEELRRWSNFVTSRPHSCRAVFLSTLHLTTYDTSAKPFFLEESDGHFPTKFSCKIDSELKQT